MLTMILKMTGATTLYVAATILLWRFWHKKKTHTLLQKLAVGLFYGLCSIASSHIGINYGIAVLNVRDIGPLAAGLFFDPLAGILSGLIGGIERFIIGEYFGIGPFTRVACSVSTVLAGLLSAALHKWIYRGTRPSVVNSLLLGAEMEVFHMYAVFITNRNDMGGASEVVRLCAMPMIAFTAIGIAACSAIIARISGIRWKAHVKKTKKNTPIDIRFQRWLLAVILGVFSIGLGVKYNLLTSIANDTVKRELTFEQARYEYIYQDSKDPDLLEKELDANNYMNGIIYLLVDTERMLQLTCLPSTEENAPADPQQAAFIVEHAGGGIFNTSLRQYGMEKCLCISSRMDDSLYLLIGASTETVYANRETDMMETLFLEILIATTLYVLIGVLVTRLVVRNLDSVNASLTKITGGNLTEVVEVGESAEFSRLSDDINRTVTALRDLIDAAEKRMEEELTLAAEIQESALPRNFNLPFGNIELYASMTPARVVGGDFYDFFYTGIDQLALVMADVSGKGIPAAMFMMRAKTAIRNFARDGLGPAKTLESVNNFLCEDNDTQMFVTVWLGILDLKTGLLRCANAGHEYPVLKRAGGDYSVLRDEHGFVLGGFENITISEYEIQLNPGDRLFIYTDGIPEARNEAQKQYGLDRLAENLNKVKDESQEQVLGSMLGSVREFAGNEEQFDDITMLGFTWFPPDSEKA